MSEEQSVLNTLTFSFSVQALDGEVLPSPIYRIVLNISYGDSVGALQSGYYVKYNDDVYFITKQAIQVTTPNEATKVFAFLQKTQVPFTVSVKHEQTRSGYQYVQLHYINLDSQLYTLKQFQVYKGLWREIEGALYQNKSPEIAKFSGGKLDWVAELKPEHKLSFTQPSVISATIFANQGHLQVFKMPQLYTLPYYIYSQRKKVTFFNHSIKGDMYVIPLGPEMRIVHLCQEAQIVSTDHDPIHLEVGEYLLIHPRPRDRVD